MSDERVARDKVVSVTYIIHDQNDEIFEYTDLPVSYLHGGHSDLFEKIEQALEDKAVGDEVDVTLTPAEAFGPHDPGLTFTDDIDNVPPELRRVGAQLEAQNAQGDVMQFRVTDISEDKLTVDGNHPLAGQTVKFHVTVKEIREPTPEELKNGGVEQLYQGM